MSFFTRDFGAHIDFKEALAQAQITGTTNGVIVDTHDYNAVAFAIHVGDVANLSSVDYLTVSVQEGDESNLSDAATVASNRILGPAVVLNASSQANTVLKLGVAKGTKRYMRLVFTETTGNSGADVDLDAVALLGGKDTSWSPRS